MARVVAIVAAVVLLRAAAAGAVTLDAVRAEMLEMERTASAARKLMVAFMRSAPNDTARLARLSTLVEKIDRENAERLAAILGEYGWPTVEMVGAEAAGAVFTLVEYARHDPGFQREAVALAERAFERGAIPGEALALLSDRVRVGAGEDQLYGTQAEVADGRLRVLPIADPDGLAGRRARLGLPPHADYLATLRRAYGLPDQEPPLE